MPKNLHQYQNSQSGAPVEKRLVYALAAPEQTEEAETSQKADKEDGYEEMVSKRIDKLFKKWQEAQSDSERESATADTLNPLKTTAAEGAKESLKVLYRGDSDPAKTAFDTAIEQLNSVAGSKWLGLRKTGQAADLADLVKSYGLSTKEIVAAKDSMDKANEGARRLRMIEKKKQLSGAKEKALKDQVKHAGKFREKLTAAMDSPAAAVVTGVGALATLSASMPVAILGWGVIAGASAAIGYIGVNKGKNMLKTGWHKAINKFPIVGKDSRLAIAEKWNDFAYKGAREKAKVFTDQMKIRQVGIKEEKTIVDGQVKDANKRIKFLEDQLKVSEGGDTRDELALAIENRDKLLVQQEALQTVLNVISNIVKVAGDEHITKDQVANRLGEMMAMEDPATRAKIEKQAEADEKAKEAEKKRVKAIEQKVGELNRETIKEDIKFLHEDPSLRKKGAVGLVKAFTRKEREVVKSEKLSGSGIRYSQLDKIIPQSSQLKKALIFFQQLPESSTQKKNLRKLILDEIAKMPEYDEEKEKAAQAEDVELAKSQLESIDLTKLTSALEDLSSHPEWNNIQSRIKKNLAKGQKGVKKNPGAFGKFMGTLKFKDQTVKRVMELMPQIPDNNTVKEKYRKAILQHIAGINFRNMSPEAQQAHVDRKNKSAQEKVAESFKAAADAIPDDLPEDAESPVDDTTEAGESTPEDTESLSEDELVAMAKSIFDKKLMDVYEPSAVAAMMSQIREAAKWLKHGQEGIVELNGKEIQVVGGSIPYMGASGDIEGMSSTLEVTGVEHKKVIIPLAKLGVDTQDTKTGETTEGELSEESDATPEAEQFKFSAEDIGGEPSGKPASDAADVA